MKKLFRTILIALICLSAQAASAETFETSAKQAIVMDYDTGMVMLKKNADEHMPTSSMSKVMTMYVIFQAIKDGRLSMDDELPVSEKAWRMGGSKMFVAVDSKVKVSDLVQGVIVQSGNDATVVLAEGLAGSEAAFSDMLNQKAAELGMTNSHFMNASGWPDPDHFSSAHDLAILAKAFIKNFPEYYPYFAEKEFTYNGIKQGNRNPLLYDDVGADGVKTGHTEDGGYGLIGSGVRNGRRVIFVINGLENSKARIAESVKLMQWSLDRFANHTILKSGDMAEEAPVVLGSSQTVALVPHEDVVITLPRSATRDFKATAHYKSPLVAPVHKGDEIGTLEVESPDTGSITVPLYAGADVQPLDFFQMALAKAQLMIRGAPHE